MDKTMLMELTSDIVAAHVGHNSVEAGDIPRLIQSVYGALASAGHSQQASVVAPEPKVPVRSSVKPDAIACLECGARMKMLKRHIWVDHGLTPAAYRARWSLARDYPMVAPSYSAKRQELAKSLGLGRKRGTGMGSGKVKNAAATDGG